MAGWISVHRQLQEHWLWKDKPFSKGQAWIDLLLLVNHDDNKTLIDGELVLVKRGQKITSIRKLADRWGWSRHKVDDFLKLLESDKMLEQNRDSKKTVISILNYSDYQDIQNNKEPPKSHQRATKEPVKDTNNNDNNINNNNINTNVTFEEVFPDVEIKEKDKIFITLLLNNHTEHSVTEIDIKNWKELYPVVNIEQELRNMKGWLIANPTKRKTPGGINRFINNWLMDKQDKGGSKNNGLRNTGGNRDKGTTEIYDYDKFFD